MARLALTPKLELEASSTLILQFKVSTMFFKFQNVILAVSVNQFHRR